MISFDEAFDLVRAAATPLGKEVVCLEDAAGRVLAEPVRAQISAPRSDVSAMDGYAVREADLGAYPVTLRIVGESFPARGHSGALAQGACVRIFTGGALPPGADRVVIQEIVRRDGDSAIIEAAPGASRHIRGRGVDFEEGDVLLEAGRRLDSRGLVAVAGADLAEVVTWRQPIVSILSTGDELADPGRARTRPDMIPESVSFGIAELARDWGAVCAGSVRLRDELRSMEQAAAQALERSDLVVVTGGASVGERDFAKRMFEDAGLEPADLQVFVSGVVHGSILQFAHASIRCSDLRRRRPRP